jgi:hypothetical protein
MLTRLGQASPEPPITPSSSWSRSTVEFGTDRYGYPVANFTYPMINGMHVDHCLTWAAQCDEPAASAFCRTQGLSHATAWHWVYGARTIVQGTGQICPDPQACGGFDSIVCAAQDQGGGDWVRANASTVANASTINNAGTFVNPMYNGYRLDWCRTFETDCGAPAADAFCKAQGFGGLITFKFQPRPGAETMTIGQNSVCDPRWHGCNSFEFVRCR